MTRLNKDDYYLCIAELTAKRGECIRRQVGAVIIDFAGRIVSTGYNGVAPSSMPCIDSPCMVDYRNPESLNKCKASHAEISALVHLRDPYIARTIYCTTEPCWDCTKAILLTQINRVVFRNKYHTSGRELWCGTRSSENWICLPGGDVHEIHSI